MHMSTQVRFSESRSSWKTPRPNLVPEWFFGNGLNNPHSVGRQSYDNELPRRSDRLPQTYGKGTPKAQSAITDSYGIHTPRETAYEIAETMEGSVKLPIHVQAGHYTPTIAALDFLTNTVDTRLQAQPNRYYR